MKNQIIKLVGLGIAITAIILILTVFKKDVQEFFISKVPDTLTAIDQHNQPQTAEYEKLKTDFAQAQTQNTVLNSDLQKALNQIGQDKQHVAALKDLVKQYQSENKRLKEISEGKGSATVTGGGAAATESTYSDNWVTIQTKVHSDSLKSLEYQFDFNVGDVQATFEDENNNETQIYNVFLQSKKDTTQYMYLGDYRRSIVNQKPYYKKWDFWNPYLHLNAELGGETAEVGLSFSFISYGAGNDVNDILFFLPDVGITTGDFKTCNLVAGLGRFNIARWIPLVHDLHIAPHIAAPFNNLRNIEFRLAIGTSL